MYVKLAVLSTVLFLGVTSTAAAHTSQYNAAKARYYKASGVVRWIGNHARHTQYHPNPKIKHRWQKAVRYWVKVRKEAWATMHPAPVVSHWQGWWCIHGGEGNGWNPTHKYSGPLQMTPYWAHYPVYDWNTLPIADVFAKADHIAQQHGYSYRWMQRQWPNTFPPCARYF